MEVVLEGFAELPVEESTGVYTQYDYHWCMVIPPIPCGLEKGATGMESVNV